MKKIISLFIILTVILSAFVACRKTPDKKDYTLSIGAVVTADAAKLKLSETVAAIVTDDDDRIVLCRLDSFDYSVKYNDDGTLDTTALTSKAAAGAAYATMPAGTWTEQGKALEEIVKGKTRSEVSAIVLDGGTLADADLKTTCSINVKDLMKAIDKAFESEHKTSFKSDSTLSAGLYVTGSPKDTSKDGAKSVKLSATYSASVLSGGNVVAAIIDSADAEFKFKSITDYGTASVDFKGTKRELGASYAEMPAGTWHAQADAYAKQAVGKSADDIATLATEGIAGCTINTVDFKEGIEASVKSAR